MDGKFNVGFFPSDVCNQTQRSPVLYEEHEVSIVNPRRGLCRAAGEIIDPFVLFPPNISKNV